jgi:hypothetical protein
LFPLFFSQFTPRLPRSAGLQEGKLQAHISKSPRKAGKMPTNAKGTKGLGKALIDAVGFLSFLFGSLILLAMVFGAIGGIFMSTKRLFQVKRVKRDKDNSHREPEGQDR